MVQDSTGNVVLGFAEFIGEATNTVLKGLEMCHQQNVTHIWLEVDSQAALSVIHLGVPCHWMILDLVIRIEQLL